MKSMFPIEHWLDGYVVEHDLQGPISKARAEFQGQSEEQTRAFWTKFEGICNQWMQDYPDDIPRYTPLWNLVSQEGKSITEYGGRYPPVVDYVALLNRMLAAPLYPPLQDLLRTMHKAFQLSLSKIFAVLLLHEASLGNRNGVIEVSNLMDKIYKFIHPLAEQGNKTLTGRKKGGKTKAARQSATVSTWHEKAIAMAKELRESGRASHELSALVARRLGKSPRTVRKILQDAELVKKRTSA
jgi:hypothetical protein